MIVTSTIKNNIDIEDITISHFLNILWQKKLFILVLTCTFAISSVYYSLSLNNYYKSSSLLVVISESDQNNQSSLMSQYSGLASMAGINLGSGGANSADIIIEQIKSRDFVKHLITFDGVLQNLIATKSYDTKSRGVLFDEGMYKNGKWIREPKNGNVIPSYIEAHQKFIGDTLSISKDDKSGLIKISIEHLSPYFSQSFLSLIISELNKLNGEYAKTESEAAIKFLLETTSETQISSLQNSINNLIEVQMKTLMLADIKEYYSIKPIDFPFLPEKKSKPSRALICITLTILGFMLSCLICITQFFYRKK